MRTFNEDKTKEMSKEECSNENGYFTEETIVTGHRPSLMEIVENKDGSKSTTTYDSLDITETVLIYKPFTAKDRYDREIYLLENWFNNEYKELYEKCKRKIDLGLKLRDGSDPKETLNALYAEAESKADRIHRLKELIAEEE